MSPAAFPIPLEGGLTAWLPEAVVAVDASGIVTHWNPTAADLFGWSVEDAVGSALWRLWGTSAVRAGGGPGDLPVNAGDIVVACRDGRAILVRASVSAIVGPDGRTRGAVLIARDVTDDASTAQRYAEIVENSPLGIFRTTPEGRLEYSNPAGAAMLGFASPDAMLRAVRHMEDVYEDPGERQAFLRTLEEPDRRPFLTRFRRRDGVAIPVEIRARFHAMPDGRRRIEGMVQDLSSQHGQRALNNRLAAIVASTPNAILSTDLSGVVMTWNPGAERMFGYSAAEIEGRAIFDLLIPPDLRNAVRPRILAALGAGQAFEGIEVEGQRRDGQRLTVCMSTAPLQDADGVLRGASVIIQDVTARKAAEAAREEARRIQEVDRTLREFINAAAHDLNTPLTPLKIQVAIIRQAGESLPRSLRDSIDMIARNIDRMALLVQDLLDVARLEAGTLKITPQAVAASNLLEEARRTFVDAAAEKGVVVEDEVVEGHVLADSRRILQVLFNLVGNAVKFTPPGGRVRIHAHADGDQVRFAVRDTGVGLTAEQIGQLFRPFVQVHTEMSNPPKGTGLGLYISKGIVAQHGGQIGVESAGPGQGSTFWFTLERADSAARDPATEAVEQNSASGIPAQGPRAPKED